MKEKLLFVGFGFLLLVGCNSTVPNELEEEQTPEMVGDDLSENGCKASAGESWSELRQDCVRLFEVATRLNPLYLEEEQPVISAFVLLNQTKTKAELFIPNHAEKTLILSKNTEGNFAFENYVFKPKDSSLWFEGKEIYVLDSEE